MRFQPGWIYSDLLTDKGKRRLGELLESLDTSKAPYHRLVLPKRSREVSDLQCPSFKSIDKEIANWYHPHIY